MESTAASSCVFMHVLLEYKRRNAATTVNKTLADYQWMIIKLSKFDLFTIKHLKVQTLISRRAIKQVMHLIAPFLSYGKFRLNRELLICCCNVLQSQHCNSNVDSVGNKLVVVFLSRHHFSMCYTIHLLSLLSLFAFLLLTDHSVFFIDMSV